MFKQTTLRAMAMVGVVLALLLVAPHAAATYAWGTRSVSVDGVVMGYSYGQVSGQFLQLTSAASARATGGLDGRGVYAYVNSYQSGSGAQYRNFRHPNTTSTSYSQTTMTASYSTPTYLTWYARGRACVDIAWAPDPCGSYSTAGTVY